MFKDQRSCCDSSHPQKHSSLLSWGIITKTKKSERTAAGNEKEIHTSIWIFTIHKFFIGHHKNKPGFFAWPGPLLIRNERRRPAKFTIQSSSLLSEWTNLSSNKK